MTGGLRFQIRIDLGDADATLARRDSQATGLDPLSDILRRHHATVKCQYDAFADYAAEAEQCGIEKYPLYAWTKATIEDPAKQAKYIKSFTMYVNGDEVYTAEIADALEADLRPLVEEGRILRLARYDTNPANNPQPPARYRT